MPVDPPPRAGTRPAPPRPGAFVAAAGAPSAKVFACSRHTVDALFEVIGAIGIDAASDLDFDFDREEIAKAAAAILQGRSAGRCLPVGFLDTSSAAATLPSSSTLRRKGGP
jgi:hypothetical protein